MNYEITDEPPEFERVRSRRSGLAATLREMEVGDWVKHSDAEDPDDESEMRRRFNSANSSASNVARVMGWHFDVRYTADFEVWVGRVN